MWHLDLRQLQRFRRDLSRRVKLAAVTVTDWRTRLVKVLPVVSEGLRLLLVGTLWISFDAYALGWNLAQPRIKQWLGVALGQTHRLIFCLLLSLLVGHVILFMHARLQPNLWTMLFWTGHAFAIHLCWDSGARWCRRQLGIRPLRHADPKRAYASMDFGN